MNISTLELRVRYKETDKMGRVYHSNYFVWFDMARTEYLREHGCSYKEQEAQGVFFVVAEAKNKYLASLDFDDIVEIKTKIVELKNVSVTFEYDCYNKNTGKLICQGFTKLGIVDKNGKIIKMPEQIVTALGL